MAMRRGTDDLEAARFDAGFPLAMTAQRFDGARRQLERLAKVRLRTLPSCRNSSRTRMAGGELRFLMVSTCMAIMKRGKITLCSGNIGINDDLHGHEHSAKRKIGRKNSIVQARIVGKVHSEGLRWRCRGPRWASSPESCGRTTRRSTWPKKPRNHWFRGKFNREVVMDGPSRSGPDRQVGDLTGIGTSIA